MKKGTFCPAEVSRVILRLVRILGQLWIRRHLTHNIRKAAKNPKIWRRVIHIYIFILSKLLFVDHTDSKPQTLFFDNQIRVRMTSCPDTVPEKGSEMIFDFFIVSVKIVFFQPKKKFKENYSNFRLTLTRPIGLPPHAPVPQKIANQC